jgi:hypothetical protein
MKTTSFLAAAFALIMVVSGHAQQPVHRDVPFVQDYSIRYELADSSVVLHNVRTDRNGLIKIMSSAGLMKPYAGQFLYPGTLVADPSYRPMSDKNLAAMDLYRQQFVYLDDEAVLSNAWAGHLYSRHDMPDATHLAGGEDFGFLISDGTSLVYLVDSRAVWKGSLKNDRVLDLQYDPTHQVFLILGESGVYAFNPDNDKLSTLYTGPGLTCFGLAQADSRLLVGTGNGYLTLDAANGREIGKRETALPWKELTVIQELGDNVWFGSTRGAFMLRDDGRFNYYASKRWLPDDHVVDIAAGPEGSVLVLTSRGLGRINFEEMTLYDKAMFFQKQVRERHIRHGFNAMLVGMENGNVSTGYMPDNDNDGLWTSMYLAGEVFRYVVTESEDALQNIRESLDAMERLFTINPVPGFPSRSFLRRGYKYDHDAWRRAEDPEWDWKATTSSDEAIGHIFVYGTIAELIDDEALREQAVMLIDTLMSHVVKNDFYLIDWNGKPTLWGRWHPDYVNGFAPMVGDRKLNSSNIIGMLQTAYHFTGKEKYKDAAFMLMEEHGYLENMMRPIGEIGRAPENADDWAAMLSKEWNHSDDEMYYVGYWGLYRYAFNDTLKAMYKASILDHWEAERPEKEGLWNIFTAMVGVEEFDLEEAIWYLQEYPLDLIDWTVRNSHRQDIELVEPNFRNQTTREVLPPDELPISKHNANRFDLDREGRGGAEHTAGDIWILPYWMGRYFGVISAPEGENK